MDPCPQLCALPRISFHSLFLVPDDAMGARPFPILAAFQQIHILPEVWDLELPTGFQGVV